MIRNVIICNKKHEEKQSQRRFYTMKEEKLGEKGSDKVGLQILGKRVMLIKIKKKERKNLVLMQYQYIIHKIGRM